MREDFIVLVIVGLVCGFVDCSLGMGYGVTSATVLVSFDIAPAVASASVHAAEVFVDSKSAVSHLKSGTVSISPLLLHTKYVFGLMIQHCAEEVAEARRLPRPLS
jgi:uncharacterized membrane protein YfcA